MQRWGWVANGERVDLHVIFGMPMGERQLDVEARMMEIVQRGDMYESDGENSYESFDSLESIPMEE